MYFDRHFKRPNDNQLRVSLYAVAAVVVVGTAVLTAGASFAQWNGRDSTQGGDYGHTYDGCGSECGNETFFGRATDSGLRGAARSGSVTQNSAGRLSGPV